MKDLTLTDLNWIVSRIPKALRTVMQKYPLYLAGGFARAVIAGEKPSDYDMFSVDAATLGMAANELCGLYQARLTKTENAITIFAPPRIPVQFITRWVFKNATECMESFDFTVCQAAIYWDTTRWRSTCNDNFYADLAAKRLVYTYPQRVEDCGGSMMRVRKYLSRGYNIQAESLAGVITRLVLGSYKKGDGIHTMSEHQCSKVLCGLLREVDPLTIVDGMEVMHEEEETK